MTSGFWRRRAAIFIALSAAATSATAASVVETRIAGFRDMGSAFKNIGDDLKSARPNRAHLQASAKVVRDYGMRIPTWFPPGSLPPPTPPESFIDRIRDLLTPADESGQAMRSHARPVIWARPAEFRAAAARFQNASDALWRDAGTAPVSVVTARYKATADTCDACHRTFREKLK